jgi:zinc protease
MGGAVERITVNGVATYVAQRPGPTEIGIVFGVGVADEPLPLRGITHMCEHLVLASADRRRGEFNGWVDATTTGLYLTGDNDDAMSFIAGIVAALHDPPFQRLEIERSVLQTEAQQAHRSALEVLLSLRFGASSFGRLDWPEYGLDTVTPSDIVEWLDRHFHRGRCSMWLASEDLSVIEHLDLPLASGRPTAPVRATREVLRTPLCVTDDVPPALSMVGLRSVAARAAMALFENRLVEELRHERGIAYGVHQDYLPLSPDRAHVLFVTDSPPQHRVEAADVIMRCIDDFVARGPADDDLERYCSQIIALEGTDAALVGTAGVAAIETVLGVADPPLGFAETLIALDGPAVRVAFESWTRSLLLVAPAGTRPWPRSPRRPPLSGVEMVGSTYSTTPAHEPMSLVVSDDGVSLRSGGFVTTVRADACAARFHQSDRYRSFVGEDGREVDVWTAAWGDRHRLVEHLDTVFGSAPSIELSAQHCDEHEPAPPKRRHLARTLERRIAAVPWWAWIVLMLGVSATIQRVTGGGE